MCFILAWLLKPNSAAIPAQAFLLLAQRKKKRGPTLGPLAYISIVCCSLALYHAAANELVAIVPRGKLTRCNAPLRLIEEYV